MGKEPAPKGRKKKLQRGFRPDRVAFSFNRSRDYLAFRLYEITFTQMFTV